MCACAANRKLVNDSHLLLTGRWRIGETFERKPSVWQIEVGGDINTLGFGVLRRCDSFAVFRTVVVSIDVTVPIMDSER